ncbi:MAG: hypothetical protein JEZ12_27510 [Desulfobacterium sp.]|nr:hypothetical protein [Desulfobacterium sp.]
MEPVYFDCHSLLKIRAPGIPGKLNQLLCRELGRFVTKHLGSPARADIVMEPVANIPEPAAFSHHMASRFGFRVIHSRGSVAAVFEHRGTPDVMVVFSDPVKIFYRDRIGIERRVYAMVLFSMMRVLNKKNSLLCHGAVVRHHKNAFLLAGPRGTGKTMLVLSLLRRGWDYLSDDKFMLRDNTAHIFQPFIVLRGHHFSALPWLGALDPGYDGFARNARRQTRIQEQITRFLPRKWLPSLDRFLNPCIRVGADAFSRQTRILDSVKLSAGVLLCHGSQFTAARVSRGAFLNGFGLIQQMAAREFSDLEKMINYHDPGLGTDAGVILDQNMAADTFVKITLPPDKRPDAMATEVAKCLEQL